MDGAQVSKVVILAMATYTSCTFHVGTFKGVVLLGAMHVPACMHGCCVSFFFFACMRKSQVGTYH